MGSDLEEVVAELTASGCDVWEAPAGTLMRQGPCCFVADAAKLILEARRGRNEAWRGMHNAAEEADRRRRQCYVLTAERDEAIRVRDVHFATAQRLCAERDAIREECDAALARVRDLEDQLDGAMLDAGNATSSTSYRARQKTWLTRIADLEARLAEAQRRGAENARLRAAFEHEAACVGEPGNGTAWSGEAADLLAYLRKALARRPEGGES